MKTIMLGLKTSIVDETGTPTNEFWGKLTQISNAVGAVTKAGFPVHPEHTKASLPDPTKAPRWANAVVTDAASGPGVYVNDGTSWRKVSDWSVLA